MPSKTLAAWIAVLSAVALGAAPPSRTTREFKASSGGALILDLRTGGTVVIEGTDGSSISVAYTKSCVPECEVAFEETGDGLKVTTRFTDRSHHQNADVHLEFGVPRSFDVELDSMGGGLSIDGVEGRFSGKTMGGELAFHEVQGEVELTTMGGSITVRDSTLDGTLETMGGEVLLENVVGDVRGSSMGGDVRYKNVRRRDGKVASPDRVGEDLEQKGAETVQISTMGGEIRVEEAYEGADLHTMGGDVDVQDARRFVRAKTMGGDVRIGAVDGWVQATTMGGDIEVTMTGQGGEATLESMSGDVVLHVPRGFGMDLDLEIAFTRNSSQEYRIEAPGGHAATLSPEWDYQQGSPRKYIRMNGPVNGGGQKVSIRTVNGNVTVAEGR